MFAAELRPMLDEQVEDPRDVQIRQVVPEIALRLDRFDAVNSQQHLDTRYLVERHLDQFREKLISAVAAEVSRTWQMGCLVWQPLSKMSSQQPQPPPPSTSSQQHTSPSFPAAREVQNFALPNSAPPSLTVESFRAPPASLMAQRPLPEFQSLFASPSESSATSPPSPHLRPHLPRQNRHPRHPTSTGLPPAYSMSRSHTTVRQLCEEWYSGIDGQPSIRHLEEHWGRAWRRASTEDVFFGRRRVIIDELERLVAGGCSSREAAIIDLDGWRGTASLDKLVMKIKNRKKDGLNGRVGGVG
ncbi:hypothetical protein K402DRAFT_126669 [Aulographum hederae CBS 113979]|uniref:Transcription activator GCR1-like domain-containing protein n=1 Tax=Aulographum hederae CBS 113979 TaxID=1176131 RepID=A0A6G1H0K5_9PEZI|nr:hypothetical protein K402DRAFT_82911 [Aulographum hederae CBS 113979]KAF1991503.1 hypothetical protein K402DRAFT_126669 [Aulographum hederae CBS 113979]